MDLIGSDEPCDVFFEMHQYLLGCFARAYNEAMDGETSLENLFKVLDGSTIFVVTGYRTTCLDSKIACR